MFGHRICLYCRTILNRLSCQWASHPDPCSVAGVSVGVRAGQQSLCPAHRGARRQVPWSRLALQRPLLGAWWCIQSGRLRRAVPGGSHSSLARVPEDPGTPTSKISLWPLHLYQRPASPQHCLLLGREGPQWVSVRQQKQAQSRSAKCCSANFRKAGVISAHDMWAAGETCTHVLFWP